MSTTTNDELTFLGSLTVVTCWCEIRHAVPVELRNFQRRQFDDGKKPMSIYCPLGHKHIPAGRRKVDELEDRLVRAKDSEQWYRDRLRRESARTEHERRSAAAYKGHLTRMRNRVANGLCPQAGCKRSFTQLHDHIRTCHPDLVESLGVEL